MSEHASSQIKSRRDKINSAVDPAAHKLLAFVLGNGDSREIIQSRKEQFLTGYVLIINVEGTSLDVQDVPVLDVVPRQTH